MQVQSILNLYEKYSLVDIIHALNILELWPRNVAAPIKIRFARALALSHSRYDEKKQISSYNSFSEFLNNLIPCLPDFHGLEDFSPPADWGEIKISKGNVLTPVFYGTSVERIIDYIDAFKISNTTNTEAISCLESVLKVQSDCISQITIQNNQPLNTPDPGHLEIPPYWFWEKIYPFIQNLVITFEIPKKLIATPNTHSSKPFDLQVFLSNASQRGFPYSVVFVNGSYVPLSIRTFPETLLEHWDSTSTIDQSLSALYDYLQQRYNGIYKGEEWQLYYQSEVFNFPHALFYIASNENPILFVLCDKDMLGGLNEQLANFFEKVPKNEFLFLRNLPSSSPVSFKRENLLVQVILRFSSPVTNSFFVIEECQYLDLASFISFSNSIETLSELHKFWEIYDSTIKIKTGDPFNYYGLLKKELLHIHSNYDFIFIDPHEGNFYRFIEQRNFCEKAPKLLPLENRHWKIKNYPKKNTIQLNSLHEIFLSTTFSFLTFQIGTSLYYLQGRLDCEAVETFSTLIVDYLSRNENLLKGIPLFQKQHIVICIKPYNVPQYSSFKTNNSLKSKAVVDAYKILKISKDSIRLSIRINIEALMSQLLCAHDAAPETQIFLSLMLLLGTVSKCPFPLSVVKKFELEKNNKARFPSAIIHQKADFPLDCQSILPTEKNIYDALILISTLFKTKGIVSGTYKGKDAKGLLNQLCSCSLHYLEEKINQLNFDKTIRSFIEQFNILLFTNEISKVRASYAIEQDTDFDPIEDISKIKSDLFDARAAYQYLIEKTLSLSSKATFSPSKKDIESLLGLAILRNRFSFLADMIHYSGKNVEITLSNLDGLHWKVDSSIEESLAAFSYAKTRLEVTHKYDSCSAPDGFEIQTLQKAFLDDTGFQMDDLLGILKLLTTPVRCSLFKENKLLYS